MTTFDPTGTHEDNPFPDPNTKISYPMRDLENVPIRFVRRDKVAGYVVVQYENGDLIPLRLNQIAGDIQDVVDAFEALPTIRLANEEWLDNALENIARLREKIAEQTAELTGELESWEKIIREHVFAAGQSFSTPNGGRVVYVKTGISTKWDGTKLEGMASFVPQIWDAREFTLRNPSVRIMPPKLTSTEK